MKYKSIDNIISSSCGVWEQFALPSQFSRARNFAELWFSLCRNAFRFYAKFYMVISNQGVIIKICVAGYMSEQSDLESNCNLSAVAFWAREM